MKRINLEKRDQAELGDLTPRPDLTKLKNLFEFDKIQSDFDKFGTHEKIDLLILSL